MANKKTVIVKQKENVDEVPAEIIAQSIRNISDSMSKIRNSGLNDKALLILVAAYSGESQRTVKIVLDALDNLEAAYCMRRK